MKPRSARRTFLRDAGVGLLAFAVGGREWLMTPAEARAEGAPLRVLPPQRLRTLEAFGETLVPGSVAAGLAHFIDHQLAAPPVQQLSMIRYLGVQPPFAAFYTGGLEALDTAASQHYGATFAELEDGQRTALARQVAQANPDGWQGPPAPLFYFVLRSDAVDVVYGTQDGLERLGLPYMAHIEPPSRWGA